MLILKINQSVYQLKNTMQQSYDSVFPKLYSQDGIDSQERLLGIQTPTDQNTQVISLDKCNISITKIVSDTYQEEVFEDIDLTWLTRKGSICIQQLLFKLSTETNIFFEGFEILLYLPSEQIFLNCGVYPFNQKLIIDVADVINEKEKCLKMKLSQTNWCLAHIQMMRNTSQLMLDGPPTRIDFQTSSETKGKMTSIKNFQKVGYIVKRILGAKQKKKQGFSDREYLFRNDRNFTKKSIEDYFYQIKMGFKYGYDFNENCQQNMKHLREFVKKMEAQRKRRKQIQVEKENVEDPFDYIS